MAVRHQTVSGVWVSDDFRSNLIIDRYDPQLATIRDSKREAMRSENSEDVLTWNVFRSLRQINPGIWVPQAMKLAFGVTPESDVREARIELWRRLPPPPGLAADEGESEIDVIVETADLVWVMEAKYRSDVSTRTTHNDVRDQVLRNIDVGSWYAGARSFFFSLLILDSDRSPVGVSLIEKYRNSVADVAARLPHRSDFLANVKGIGLVRWAHLAALLRDCEKKAAKEERMFAGRAADWLLTKDIGPG